MSDHKERAYLNLYTPMNDLKLKIDNIKLGEDMRM